MAGVCGKWELDIFNKPPVQDCIVASDWLIIHPSQNLNDGGPLFYNVPVQEGHWMDTCHSYLAPKLRVFQEGATEAEQKLPAPQPGPNAPPYEVSASTNFLNSLFSQVMVSINGTEVGQTAPVNPISTNLAILANYENPTSGSNSGYGMGAIMIQEDVPLSKENFNSVSSPDIQESKLVALSGKLLTDWFSQGKLLPSGVKLTVQLNRSPPETSLITLNNKKRYFIKLEECPLRIRRVQLSAQTASYLTNRLAREPAIYPFTKMDVRSFIVSSGRTTHKAVNLWNGRLPARAFLMFRPLSAAQRFKGIPLRFRGHKVNYVDFMVNEKSVLCQPYKPDYDNDQFLDVLQGFYQTLRILGKDAKRQMSNFYFRGGYAIYGVDLSPDMSSYSPSQTGNFSVEVRFKEAPTEELEGILVGEFSHTVTIDKNGQVNMLDA
jgi:hypothetical protein